MSSPPAAKRHKSSGSTTSPPRPLAQQTTYQNPAGFEGSAAMAPPSTSPTSPRKRRHSGNNALAANVTTPTRPVVSEQGSSGDAGGLVEAQSSGKKKGRTNTPWSPAEEQKLKNMRDVGNSWSEIAKVGFLNQMVYHHLDAELLTERAFLAQAFPSRTEGSVKKHWYKDMHYAEFAEDESIALRDAIREYEANKWKVIGQKVGKPAKACEQYAKEHFKNV